MGEMIDDLQMQTAFSLWLVEWNQKLSKPACEGQQMREGGRPYLNT